MVPGHRQQQLTQTLIVRLLKTRFLHGSLILKSQQNRIELVTRPVDDQVAMVLCAADKFDTTGATVRILQLAKRLSQYETSITVWRSVAAVLHQIRTLTW